MKTRLKILISSVRNVLLILHLGHGISILVASSQILSSFNGNAQQLRALYLKALKPKVAVAKF
jgi:hypothetical protein